MEVQEMMIGDWYNLSTENVSINRQVDSYFYQETTTHSWMRPIELTPEILEKNGFEQDDSYDECIADGLFVEIKVWSFKDTNEDVFIQYDGMTCKVSHEFGYPCDEIKLSVGLLHDIYVHQFQHALRLCGLTDLADNFKV